MVSEYTLRLLNREASCQVHGCDGPLPKAFFKRYKICHVHASASQVEVQPGELKRFCKHCGRFHELTAFDGNKKGCRAMLEAHNERRKRKRGDSEPQQTLMEPSAGGSNEWSTLITPTTFLPEITDLFHGDTPQPLTFQASQNIHFAAGGLAVIPEGSPFPEPFDQAGDDSSGGERKVACAPSILLTSGGSATEGLLLNFSGELPTESELAGLQDLLPGLPSDGSPSNLAWIFHDGDIEALLGAPPVSP